MKEITNIDTLRRTILAVIPGVIGKRLKPDVAQAVCDASGKAISTLKLEMEYAVARKERPEIPFLQNNRQLRLKA